MPRTAGYLVVTDEFVGFATGAGPYRQYVFDLDHRELLRVGEGSLGGEMRGSGDFLRWVEFADPSVPGTAHVVRLVD